MVADIEPRQKAQCKGSVNAAKKWKLHFPGRRWNSQNLGGERRLRTSTLTQQRPKRGEDFFLDGSSKNGLLHPIMKQTQPVMMRKREVTSGLIQEISFVAIT